MATVVYCDLCSNPIKEGTYFMLYITSPMGDCPYAENYSTIQDYYQAYSQYLIRVGKEAKTICPTCKLVFDQIFEKRMIGVIDLAADLKTIYSLPTKDKKEEK